jgi:hypothetical protein
MRTVVLPPDGADPETEAALLGALLIDSPPKAEVADLLSEDDFSSQFNRRVFRALCACEPPYDLLLVRRAMGSPPDDGKTDALALSKLLDGVPHASQWRNYAAELREITLRRRRRNTLIDLLSVPDGPARASMMVEVVDLDKNIDTGQQRGLDWLDLTTEPLPIPWLVRNIVPEQGRMLLIAPSGVGKSWLLEDLALCVALGKPWLGLENDFPVANNRGPVMIIDEESGKGSIHSRMARLATGHGVPLSSLTDRLLISCLAGINTGNPQTWGLLYAEVKRRKPCLVILDAAIRIFQGDENSSETINAFWQALSGLQAHGAAVATAHHTGWNEIGRSRGSSDFPAGANIEVTLTKTNVADRVKVTWTKVKDRYQDILPEPMLLDRKIDKTTARLVCAGDDPGETTDDPTDVLNFILEAGCPQKRTFVYNAFPNQSNRAVDRKLKILLDSKRIASSNAGYVPFDPDA